MYPFSAMPVFCDVSSHWGNFGGLPPDALVIVVRSIAHDERPSLLNLALVNRSACLVTRPRRGLLALLAEGGGPAWKSTQLQDARRFQHALCLLAQADQTIPVEAAQALFAHWIYKIFIRQNGMLWRERTGWAQTMPRQLLDMAACQPPPQASALLWKLLLAQDMLGGMFDSRKVLLLKMMKEAGNKSLPEGERQSFELACRVGGWRDTFNSRARLGDAGLDDNALSAQALQLACEQFLLDAQAWPPAARAMMLDVIATQVNLLPPDQCARMALDIIDATAAWPAVHSYPVLASLLKAIPPDDLTQEVADRMIDRLRDLYRMPQACAPLADDDKLILLEAAAFLMKRRSQLCDRCSDPAQAGADLDGIATRMGAGFIEQLVTLSRSEEQARSLRMTLANAMEAFFAWDSRNAQWTTGFTALCRANKRAHGLAYGIAWSVFGLVLFKHDNTVFLEARRQALAPLLSAGDKAIGSDHEMATWRLFISVIENHPGHPERHPRRSDEKLGLRNAEALLAEAHIMTDAAWVEMMCLTLTQIERSEQVHEIVHRVLRHAGTLADAPRAALLAHIAALIQRWQSAHQSSVAEMLVSMAGALAIREKARLLPGLLELCLHAYARNSDARLWLHAIMHVIASLPDPQKMRLLETVLDDPTLAQANRVACAALLTEVERQIATLPARPQACLLLSLSPCLGEFDDEESRRKLSGIMARLDKLDMTQPERTAWRVLYQAAYLHTRNRNGCDAQWQEIYTQADALPEPWREAVRAMLNVIDELPTRPMRKAVAQSPGCALV